MFCKKAFALVPLLALFGQLGACSSGGDESENNTPEPSGTCDIHTDLTRGTIDGAACDEAHDVVGISDQPSFDMCTEYTYETTLSDGEGTCDRTNILGYCVSVDDRDSTLVKLVYVYADDDSSLSRCDQLKIKSGQCLNRATDTWCNAE